LIASDLDPGAAGAVVALTLDGPPSLNAKRALSALRQFATDVIPAIRHFLVTGR